METMYGGLSLDVIVEAAKSELKHKLQDFDGGYEEADRMAASLCSEVCQRHGISLDFQAHDPDCEYVLGALWSLTGAMYESEDDNADEK